MSGSEQIALNGSEVWAYVVQLDGGLRMRLSLDDWERIGLHRGQRVPVRRPGHRDEWLFLAEIVELPPLAWIVLANRIRVAG
jgi:hypothetical protein